MSSGIEVKTPQSKVLFVLGICMLYAVGLALPFADRRPDPEPEPAREPTAQPWPYERLDEEEVRILGHQSYLAENSGSYGAFNAIIQPLQEKIGYPYTQIPTYMLHFGGSDIFEDEPACAPAIGAVAAINLIVGRDYEPLAARVVDYCREQVAAESFEGEDPWVSSSGRKTGDVAAKAAKILNEEATVDPALLAEFADIYPEADFEKIEEDLFKVLKEGELVGYVGVGTRDGFADIVKAAVGVNVDGTVEAVKILEEREDPGWGDAIREDEFLDQFRNLSKEDLKLTRDQGKVEAITDATVSSRTVVRIARNQTERIIADYLEDRD